jgi:hypothetical protein
MVLNTSSNTLESGGFVAAITRLSGAGGQCGRVGRRRRRVGGGGGVYIQLIERAMVVPCLAAFYRLWVVMGGER